VIGRCTGGGDQNVIITTDSGHTTHIRSRSEPNGAAQVNAIPLTIQDQCHYEGTKAWTIEGITTLPVVPTTDVNGNPHIKYFCKATKVWKTPARLLYNLDLTTWTYNNTNKTLIGPTATALSIDGVTPSVNDRILVNNPLNPFNGIYTVTVVGGSGVYPVLTRAADAGGPSGPQFLGYGYDLFAGSAVKITAGTSYTGLYFMLNVIPKAGVPALNGGEISNWDIVDNITNDQMCVMWFDGSFTTIASGPDYTVS
jgi:hypothetical protein